MLKVRQAVPADMAAVLALYDGVIDLFQAQTGNLGWRRGCTPPRRISTEPSRPAPCTLGSWRANWPPE